MPEKNCKIGFAIGNGTSREGFNLESLRGHGTIVGCNWLYKDFSPDIIVALDDEPKEEIPKIKNRSWKWMTMMPNCTHLGLDGEKAMGIIEINRTLGKNSGIIACSYLSKKLWCERVYMLGIDFFRIHPGMKKHDIYHDGLCAYRNFNKAWNILSGDCPHTEFIRVGPIHPVDVTYFKTMEDHFTFIDYLEFGRRIDSGKL